VVAVAGGGWGIIEYLQLDWMDDGMNGWMEKASRPWHPLLYGIPNCVWHPILPQLT
jgi:hypothetical protein